VIVISFAFALLCEGSIRSQVVFETTAPMLQSCFSYSLFPSYTLCLQFTWQKMCKICEIDLPAQQFVDWFNCITFAETFCWNVNMCKSKSS